VALDSHPYTHGDGWFQLGCDFMSSPVIDIMVPILALGFLIHICYGIYLSVENYKKRGGIKRYEVASKAKADSWSAKNMFVLGIIILGLLAFHLSHFWAKMQLQEFMGNHPVDEYVLLEKTFGAWWVVVLYIGWFAALWFHLTYGFWSAFQTIGWSNMIWMKRLECIGKIVATLIFAIFAVVAVVSCLVANDVISVACCCGHC
jgi:succinate dehydrogenase / fumarate reductase cytochrome b subunit